MDTNTELNNDKILFTRNFPFGARSEIFSGWNGQPDTFQWWEIVTDWKEERDWSWFSSERWCYVCSSNFYTTLYVANVSCSSSMWIGFIFDKYVFFGRSGVSISLTSKGFKLLFYTRDHTVAIQFSFSFWDYLISFYDTDHETLKFFLVKSYRLACEISLFFQQKTKNWFANSLVSRKNLRGKV